MSNTPESIHFNQIVEPIAIDSDGNAYTDLTREKESIIRSERLDATNPIVEIDLESILTGENGCAVAIAIQDFGLPPRIIEIAGEFTNTRDVANTSRDDEHYKGAPKTIFLSAITSAREKTYTFDDHDLPTTDYYSVPLKRGQSMLWAHDGLPSDERTGYIEGDFYELIALLPNDYYGAPDFSNVEQTYFRRGYIPFIGVSYKGSVLFIYSLDNSHADVLYQQVRSLDDTTDISSSEQVGTGIDLGEIVTRLRSGDDTVLEVLERVVEERSEAQTALDGLKAQLVETRSGMDNLETLLAVNKRKLRESRSETSNLQREVQRLQRQNTTSSQSQKSNESFFDNQSRRNTTEADPHGHCSVIGIDPAFLFSLTPEGAARVVKGIHKGLVMEFHSDLHGKGDEDMKTINVAVDFILERIQQGYWVGTKLMTNPGEQYPLTDPVNTLGESISRRYSELATLHTMFDEGMELVSDMSRVNEIIAASSRPDLVMTEPVELMPVDNPRNLGRINNFYSNMRGFGAKVFEPHQDESTGEIEQILIGRRPYTEEERSIVFLLGARGGYHEYRAFAAEHGIDEKFALDVLMETEADDEAFMRMWITLPSLTEWLMSQCLQKTRFDDAYINEELFVAYNILAKLADINDHGMINKDGSVDTWYFCH